MQDSAPGHRAHSATGSDERWRLICLSATSICAYVSLTVFQHADHRFTDDNNADTRLLSNDLHDISYDFTQMEEMPCSLASPYFLMWVSKGG
jgi:hypothetical protein